MTASGTILIADYDFADVEIERSIIEGAGFELRAAQCKSEEDVIEAGRDVEGVLAQYANIGLEPSMRVIRRTARRKRLSHHPGAAHHLFGEQILRRMKKTALLINTARGPIVDDAALHTALSQGWIAGAALDDIEEEPAKQREFRSSNPLFQLPT